MGCDQAWQQTDLILQLLSNRLFAAHVAVGHLRPIDDLRCMSALPPIATNLVSGESVEKGQLRIFALRKIVDLCTVGRLEVGDRLADQGVSF